MNHLSNHSAAAAYPYTQAGDAAMRRELRELNGGREPKTTMTKQLITHSRQSSFKTCRKQHWFAYEQGLRRIDDARALRMGSAFHNGVEQLGKGDGLAAACDAVRASYARMPAFVEPHEWDMERETLLRMVCAYDWRWNSPLEYIAVELPFELPLINPATGKPTPHFNLAGKIDAIVRLEDGRLAVKETKLLGDDISPDSDLWRRMRIDHQISLYMLAARRLGHDVATVLYDVARKPTIQPTAVPILDELGAKIVLSPTGGRVKTERGQWRQTGDKEKGYVLQTRNPTADEWGERLSADIAERPDYYFARVEVARLDQDLDEYAAELWDIQQTIREAQKNDKHYRTVNRNTCGFCAYFSICSSGAPFDGRAPDGFEIVSDRHPELERENHVSRSTTETTAAIGHVPTPAEYSAAGENYW